MSAVKKAADLSDDSSSSEESSSEDGDEDKKMASVPAKTTPVKGMFSLGEVILDL